jgi:cell division protein FtsA
VIGKASKKVGELPKIVGYGRVRNFGMRKGVVIDSVSVAQAVDAALAEAEKVGGVSVEGATFSVSGVSLKSVYSKGSVAIAAEQVISIKDADQAVEVASAVQLPNNQRVIELVTGGFCLDGKEKTQDPTGMVASKLEAEVVVLSASEIHLRSLEKAINTANVNCDGIQPAVRAAAEAILSREEREMGVVFVDLGAQTSSLAVYEEGELRKLCVVGMGSSSVTNDLAIGLRVDVKLAEKIKLNHAEVGSEVNSSGVVEVEWETENLVFKAKDIDVIVASRLEEILEKLAAELSKLGKNGRLPGGVVISGEGSGIKGLEELAREAFELPCKKAEVGSYETSTGDVLGPEWSGAVGLMLFDDRAFNSSNGGGGRVLDQFFDRGKKILFRFKK